MPNLLLAHVPVQDKLNVYEIDAVKDALRVAIHEEKVHLMEDIDYLTALLTDETDAQVGVGLHFKGCHLDEGLCCPASNNGDTDHGMTRP
jgi:hypothetical protein